MEYEEDDDISFAKWMSSFWGHSLIDENEKEGRGYRKRQMQAFCERRASLPAKLSSIHMTRLHASTKTSSSGHLRGCKEFQEGQDIKCHCHMTTCKIPLPDGSGSSSRSNPIQEFSESFEKQLHFKSKRSVSLQPEGIKERKERVRLRMAKSRSHKKEGMKREPKREQEEESLEVPSGNKANSFHHEQALKRDISA
uniref:Leukemia NUP98 fusion partner 1 n=1 Tax=Pelusios castaneus TaxID=367368 RepID=A0A8C8RDF7_9SAUR